MDALCRQGMAALEATYRAGQVLQAGTNSQGTANEQLLMRYLLTVEERRGKKEAGCFCHRMSLPNKNCKGGGSSECDMSGS